jgi:hypothetical protein
MRLLVALIVAVAGTGCGDARSTCEAAVDEAVELANTQDVATVFDEAIDACASLEEFEAALEEFPDALDGGDARTFIADRCANEPAIADTPICTEVSQ